MKLLSKYYENTPKKWRKIGDLLLAVGTAITAGALIEYDTLKDIFCAFTVRVIMGLALILGVAGKFLTNFFSDTIVKDSTNAEDKK